MLDDGVALATPLPALLLGEPVCQQQLRVLRTGLVGMPRSMAHGAGPVPILTASLSVSSVDVVGLNPHAAFWSVAVDSFASGNAPFGGAGLESLFDVVWHISQDRAERDLVEAAFRRPLLLILHRGRYETGKTFEAVAVARDFDDSGRKEIV